MKLDKEAPAPGEVTNAGEATTTVRHDRRAPLALGPTIARLCEALANGDTLYVAGSEARGAAVAYAAASICNARVLWYPPSDNLPGENTPASPAVAGQRVAALQALQTDHSGKTLFVTDAAALYGGSPMPECSLRLRPRCDWATCSTPTASPRCSKASATSTTTASTSPAN